MTIAAMASLPDLHAIDAAVRRERCGSSSLLVGLLARRAGVEGVRPRHGPDRRQLAGANAQAAARGLEEASRGHVSCSLRSLRLTTLSLCGRFVSETAA